MSPKISVIIPLYNKESSINKTVESVLSQTFMDFELLIIDDGSTDNSLECLSTFKDKRIKIISKKNGGVSDARNFGIKASSSEYIYFLDADDIITEDCLSVFVDLIEKHKDAAVFVANFKVVNTDGSEFVYCSGQKEMVVQNNFKALWTKSVFPRTGSIIIKKYCFDEVGFFDINISFYEDLEFILRVLRVYKVAYSPRVVLYYIREYNTLSKKTSNIASEFSYYIEFKKKSFYERLILAEIIFDSYKKRVQNTDNKGAEILKNKFNKYFFYIIIAVLYRKSRI